MANGIKQEIIKTKNIRDAMAKYASDNFTPLNECDFIIDKVDTYIKTNADDEFKLFNEDVQAHYKNRDKILNEHVEFQQIFTIIVSKETDSNIKLNYTIEYGSYSFNPKIIIHHDSHIPYKTNKAKDIFMLLVQEINKIKAKNRMLINLFDESMIKNLKAFTKHIYANKFTKKISIPLFDGIAPDVTRAGKLIKWYEEKNLGHQIIEVAANEVLIEFKKPIFGKNGFNAYGKIISAGAEDNEEDFQAEIDEESIKIVENKDKKLYKSKIQGYVHFNNNTLVVDNKVKKSTLSRLEETLAKDEENNIEVHISQNDTTIDSIGEGVELTSETIHINGHIGANSILEATNLQIDGATHQDSSQFARVAKINRHKGTLRCNNAKIALLEGGEIHATSVHIEASLGGTIYAQDVTIGHVKSNMKIYASNSITIRLVSGEDNLFKINYRDIPILNSKLDLIDDDIEDLKYSLEEAERHNILQIPLIKEKIEHFKSEQRIIRDSTMHAKISIEKPLLGLNTIVFSITEDKELIYKTDARSYKPFHLSIDNDIITLHPVGKTISLNS